MIVRSTGRHYSVWVFDIGQRRRGYPCGTGEVHGTSALCNVSRCLLQDASSGFINGVLLNGASCSLKFGNRNPTTLTNDTIPTVSRSLVPCTLRSELMEQEPDRSRSNNHGTAPAALWSPRHFLGACRENCCGREDQSKVQQNNGPVELWDPNREASKMPSFQKALEFTTHLLTASDPQKPEALPAPNRPMLCPTPSCRRACSLLVGSG